MRVYADSSVFGGAEDKEFAKESRAFFDLVREGRFELVVSALVRDELSNAPSRVAQLYEEMESLGEVVEVTEEVLRLARAYVDAGVVTEKWEDDATHVAVASVARCALVVSWNFRHIVHYQKIPRYNAVNVLHGYPAVSIHSPAEVVEDEEG
jgi:predicted nucleic acid-binding protein